MKIIKFKKEKGNKYSLYFDDGEKIKLYDDVIIKFNLLTHKEFDYDQYEKIIEYNNKLGAYYKALKYITKKLRTEKEIYEYLIKEFNKNIVGETIEKLKREGYFNKDIYLKSYINDAIMLNNIGPLKIQDNLVKLGFSKDDIKVYLDNISDDVWLDRVDKIVNKKVKINHNYGLYKLKEKILYDVCNLGYPKWMVEDKLSNISIDNNDLIMEKEFNKFYNKLSKKYDGYDLWTQIKLKMIAKGFSYNEVDDFLNKKRSTI